MVTATIGVFGSANLDHVVRVASAPALGETITGRSYHRLVGGKGANQALAAARAGARVRMAGAVGDDADGAAIRSVLHADGIDTLTTLAWRQIVAVPVFVTVGVLGYRRKRR